ncbi:MAG: alanine--tRNA ligase [Kosmotoga sp.]|uniref:alanine--tRNA ligase n=1 Tax=Kosmotoga sp. TaxID=1955248 RepID=UPI001D478A47|nr:alanine--tRNA ligase [Kosmotoga sp.]
MKFMTSEEIRQSFLDFFKSKGHTILSSASLIPNDPQLMFTVAGMVPFKPIFWGKIEPTYPRIATCQKCIRTVDIDNVGKTPRHQTFFEMLGNFSFGDYFKKEAIIWAWEYVTEVLKIPEEKLWVSVYKEDDEAYEIWKNEIGVPEGKIVRLGKEDNWWGPAGPTGPCGPDTEIFIDTGRTENCPNIDNCSPACDCGRFLEFWNLVFTEYNQDDRGNLTPLQRKNIDTGLGLERLTAIMQGVETTFDTDLFQPVIEKIESIFSVKYKSNPEQDISIRVIADHARAIAFMIADGILPSNEGRGYVLRRLLRRADRHASLLGNKRPFLHKLIDPLIKKMGSIYPELKAKKELIEQITIKEEERFLDNLERGTKRLWQMIDAKGKLNGKDLFMLHDTYGFHVELVEEILNGSDIHLDKEGFLKLMQEQKERARAATGNKEYDDVSTLIKTLHEELGGTEFLGYEMLETRSEIKTIIKKGVQVHQLSKGEEGEVIFDKTVFYAEKGGQVSDTGILETSSGVAEVLHVYIPHQDIVLHKIKVIDGLLNKGELALLKVDVEKRKATARNHTATHLLHAALRNILGEHVKQSGSLVGPERLRFDFSHFSQLKPEEIMAIEETVNEIVLSALPVTVEEKDLEEAKSEDVIALFEEKYGDKVRVVSISDFSRELCAGTHVENTGEIGLFKIISESSVSAGVRRIDAITGKESLKYLRKLTALASDLKDVLQVQEEQILEKTLSLLQELKGKEKEIKKLKEKLLSGKTSANDHEFSIDDVKFLVRIVEDAPAELVRNTADVLMQRLGQGVVIIFNKQGDKVIFVVKVSQELTKHFNAGHIAKNIAKALGGGGGGRPDFAQAGGKEVNNIEKVVNSLEKYVRA